LPVREQSFVLRTGVAVADWNFWLWLELAGSPGTKVTPVCLIKRLKRRKRTLFIKVF
jgi:hypothetical protein